MKELKKLVRTYVVHATCECGGEFKPTNVVLTTYPPKYPHVCNKCGKGEVFDTTYPRNEYEEVPDGIIAVMD